MGADHSPTLRETKSSGHAATATANGQSVQEERAEARQRLAQNVRAQASATVLDPSFVFMQMQGTPFEAPPLRVKNGAALDRAIAVLDRTPCMQTHKIGVLYVAPGQTTEEEILGNDHGSPRYLRLLHGLGHLVELKSCAATFSGGLDCKHDSDGSLGLCWRSDSTVIMYHVTTMMRPRSYGL